MKKVSLNLISLSGLALMVVMIAAMLGACTPANGASAATTPVAVANTPVAAAGGPAE